MENEEEKVKRSFVLLFFAGIFLLTGCAMMNSAAPVSGFLYTGVKGPVTATAGPSYSKVGQSSATSILGIIATGDASIDAAMKNGNITKIHHVDYKVDSVLGLFVTYTVFVYGE